MNHEPKDNTNGSNRSNDLVAEVLASPAYRDRCAVLFDLFRLSREVGRQPERILDLEAGFIVLLTQFQNKQSEFKTANNELGVAVTKRLILILKQIADSIVWRVLGYDRVLVQLLSEHPATGHLDDTVFNDIAQAKRIIEEKGAVVLVNDLTTILRHGDLTIVGKDGYEIVETKYGKAAKRSGRAIQQKKTLNDLVSFLNTGIRSINDRRDFIFKVDVQLETYQPVIEQTIAEARQRGYHKTIVNDCLTIEGLYLNNQDATLPRDRPFNNVEHTMSFHNLQVFDQPKTRIAPYGIFPLSDQNCFDLITGDIFLSATLNLDTLQEHYRRFGLLLELPQPSQPEIDVYLSAPIAERKKLMSSGKFTIRDGNHWMRKTPDFFGRIGLEFMHEDSFIQTDRQLMNLVMDMKLSEDKNTRFYVGYKNELGIWS
jgi:hypothetical protein